MANAGPSGNTPSAAPAGAKPNTSKKRKFFFNHFAAKKFSGQYPDTPYSILLSKEDRNTFEAIVNKDKLTAKLPPGWKLYFQEDDSVILDCDRILKNIKLFRNHLNAPSSPKIDYELIQKNSTFVVDVDALETTTWLRFSEDLQTRPEHTISCLGFAMHLQLIEATPNLRVKRKYLSLLLPRIKNIELPISRIITLNTEHCGQLIRIRGTIVRSCDDTLEFLWRVFKCGRCDTKQVVLQRDGRKVVPNQCKACNQRGSDYDEDIESYFSCVVQSQSLTVQEMKRAGVHDVPGSMDILLKHDLVNKFVPGTDVMVVGVLKTKVEGIQERLYSLYLDVVSVDCNNDMDEKNFDYSQEDYSVVDRVTAEPNPLRLLVHSLCPKILGQEMIKAALLLGIFSGTPREFSGKRKEVHILLIGDPGLGKSEMLEACVSASPRGIFVSSNSCSNTGLAASMSSDSAQKSTVEAGALVMADQGICCIDELDKIVATTDVLLEAMEDQIVTVSKAGVNNKLKTKTSILAAANPIGGHYNKTKMVTDNLKIPLPILSRFDLVFIMLDQKSSPLDNRFKKVVKSSPSASSSFSSSVSSSADLPSRLHLDPNEHFEPLSAPSIQKLVSFVNRKFEPELSLEAKQTLKDYFLSLRDRPFYTDMIPVTNRTLLSLMRLTIARAKIDMVRIATKRHAEDVVTLMEFGMHDVANITEQDIIVQTNKEKMEPNLSKAKQLNNFTRILQIRVRDKQTRTFDKDDLKDLAQRAGVRSFNEILDLMNANGVLLKKAGGMYQFVDY